MYINNKYMADNMESRFDSKRQCTKGNFTEVALKAKMEELQKTKEDIMQAKKNATESCLVSESVIDEFEKLQTDLEMAKYRSIMSNFVVSGLKSQHEITMLGTKSKSEEELKAITLINQLNDKLDETCEETDIIKTKTDEDCQEKSKLQQLLLMRRQTLEALQLTNRALRLELEAYRASAAQARQHVTRSQNDKATVQLTVEEYNALIRATSQETCLNNWRVLASQEQRLAAQDSRDLAFKSLERLYYPDNNTKENKNENKTREGRSVQKEDKEERLEIIREDPETSSISSRNVAYVSERSDDRKVVPREKLSVCTQLRKLIFETNCI